jgi:serine/threonine-protein kinase
VGILPTHEILAHFISGYRDGDVIRVSVLGSAIAWVFGLALVGAATLRWRARARAALWLPVAGIAGAIGLSALGFFAVHVFIPPAAPLVLALVTGGVQATRSRRIGRRSQVGPNVEEARLALADGELDRAWRLYRSIPPTSNLKEELFELASTLDRCDCHEQAADVFHRVAVVDPHFRDVAPRLLAAARGGAPQFAQADVRGAPLKALGRYEILAIVGEGATGKVFLGCDPKINRLLAIKVIDLATEYETSELEDATDRFRREAETAGRLTHPNIVTVFDIGEADGLAYIAMEYLKGRHLSDFTKPDRLLPATLVLELVALTAEALHYAHSQNVVHRDIKPANIMYDSVSGTLKITDFGIARLIDVSRTRTGIVLGTPSFMAPEQLEGNNVNGHTDLFALGVSLYELLAGRLPFRGASMTKLMFVIANEPHPPISVARPDLPKQLDALFDVALAKSPVDRFQTGAEMADALRAVAAQMR